MEIRIEDPASEGEGRLDVLLSLTPSARVRELSCQLQKEGPGP